MQMAEFGTVGTQPGVVKNLTNIFKGMMGLGEGEAPYQLLLACPLLRYLLALPASSSPCFDANLEACKASRCKQISIAC